MVLKNGVRNIQAAAYNGARTVLKIWSISTKNLPVQDLIRQKWFIGQMQKLKISISKIKSHMLIKASFQFFVHFSTDSKTPEFKLFESGFKYSYMFT